MASLEREDAGKDTGEGPLRWSGTPEKRKLTRCCRIGTGAVELDMFDWSR